MSYCVTHLNFLISPIKFILPDSLSIEIVFSPFFSTKSLAYSLLFTV